MRLLEADVPVKIGCLTAMLCKDGTPIQETEGMRVYRTVTSL